MNIFRHKPAVAEILSGALFLGLFIITFWGNVQAYFVGDVTQALGNAGLFLLTAWIFGTFFDAIRNGLIESLIEWRFDKKAMINWDFFFLGQKEKVAQLDAHYFAYYQLDENIVIAILFYMISFLPFHFYLSMPLSPYT
jgi:hypothetical protein